MAYATSTYVALALAAAAAGAQYYNTQSTARKQDNSLAMQIRNQGDKQRQADERVGEEVEKMQGSTAEASRREALDGYIAALRKGKGTLESGLTGGFGSDAFRSDSAQAANDVNYYGQRTAGLMSRIDAPAMQRQGEAFGYGRLATDLGLIGREARGQNFLDELRLRAIRRNPNIDLFSSLASAASGAVAGGAGAAGANAGGQAMNQSIFAGMPYLGQLGK